MRPFPRNFVNQFYLDVGSNYRILGANQILELIKLKMFRADSYPEINDYKIVKVEESTSLDVDDNVLTINEIPGVTIPNVFLPDGNLFQDDDRSYRRTLTEEGIPSDVSSPALGENIFSQLLQQGIFKLLDDLSVIIRAPQLVYQRPVMSFSGLAYRTMIFMNKVKRARDFTENCNMPYNSMYGLIVNSGVYSEELEQWVTCFYRIYGEPYFLDYVDYIIWINWNIVHNPKYRVPPFPDLDENSRTFINNIRSTIEAKEHQYCSMELTNDERLFINQLQCIEAIGKNLGNKNIYYLFGEDVLRMYYAFESDPIRKINLFSFQDLGAVLSLPEPEADGAFISDYGRSFNLTKNVRPGQGVITREGLFLQQGGEATAEFKRDHAMGEIRESNFPITALGYYRQEILTAAICPLVVVQAELISSINPDDPKIFKYDRNYTMAFHNNMFRFIYMFTGYRVNDANGNTIELHPMPYIIVTEGEVMITEPISVVAEGEIMTTEAAFQWVVRTIRYYCANEIGIDYLRNCIGHIMTRQSPVETYKQNILRILDMPKSSEREKVEILFKDFYEEMDITLNEDFPLTVVEKEALYNFERML